jgi:hypothetical protein
MKSNSNPILVVCLFSVAMAVLESAVVVYLRALYYPKGFTVAFQIIDPRVLMVEIAREAATVMMLLSIGILAGKTFKDKFAYFLISFAVWDVFYYVWLKVFIGWPNSILDWDILFLIPFTWLSPVLAPVVCSITMIGLAIALLKRSSPISLPEWMLLSIGASVILYTFLVDYGTIIVDNGFYKDLANIMENKKFVKVMSSYIPTYYNWFLLGLGELFILSAIILIIRTHTAKRNENSTIQHV